MLEFLAERERERERERESSVGIMIEYNSGTENDFENSVLTFWIGIL